MTGAQVSPGVRVGVAGLGIMGSILATRLLAAGHEVAVFNRSPEPLARMRDAGAAIASTAAVLAFSCDAIFTVLTGPEALEQVLFGADGIAGASRARGNRPLIVCDLSTQDPAQLPDIGRRAEAYGIRFAEAPMAGSVHDATHGTLKFMFGGDDAVLEKLAPYFAAWGPKPVRCGAVGQAATAKLALNLLVAAMAKGLGESFRLLRAGGIPVENFIEVLGKSGLASPLYQRLAERCLAEDQTVRFSLGNLRKDIGFCMRHPGWEGRPPELVSALHHALDRLGPEWQAQDYSCLLRMDDAA